MFDMIKDWFREVAKSRLFPVTIIYVLLFFLLINRIFTLQIVNGDVITQQSVKKKDKTKYLKSTRGNIYDKNGKLLAYNELSYSITLEDNGNLSTSKEKNDMIYKLIKIIERNGTSLACEFPIVFDKNETLKFTLEGKALLNFKRDVYSLNSIEKLTQKQLDATAEDLFKYLRYETSTSSPRFLIDDKYNKQDALKIMNVRFALFLNRYNKHLPVTVATNINEKTVIAIKENSADLSGVEILTETKRKYNDSQYFAHLIGYTGVINEEEMATMKENGEADRYTASDQIGKAGVEKEMESYLHGSKGYENIIVNQTGRILKVKKKEDPVAGDDVYLTIDAKLQKECYKQLEKKIASILLTWIHNGSSYGSKGKSGADIMIPINEVYFALINNNVIDLDILNDKNASALEKGVYNKYVNKRTSVFADLDTLLSSDSKTANKDATKEMGEYLSYIYSFLSENNILLTKYINESDGNYRSYKNGKISLSEFLQYAITNNWVDLEKLDIGNKYYSSIEIYTKLIQYVKEELKKDKKFTKKIYRELIFSNNLSGKEICLLLFEQGVLKYDEEQVEKLQNGVMSSYSFIRNKIEKLEITPAQLALEPCSGSIVVTDVKTGEVRACVSYPCYDNNKYANKIDVDYFYKMNDDKSYPTLFRVIQQKTAPGSTYKMLTAFAALEEGIADTSYKVFCNGTFSEISSKPKCTGHHGNVNISQAIGVSCNCFFYKMGHSMSLNSTNHSKGLKTLAKYAAMFGFDAKSGISESEYEPNISDTDAVRSAIGQGSNNYTPSQIARYTTTIANHGTCFDLTVIDKVKDLNGKVILNNKAKVHNKLNMKESSWTAVYQGMDLVVNDATKSTIYTYFKDLNVRVAGKTGTAQESKSKPNHALFTSFAPFENPEISITAVIPNGYASGNTADLASKVYKYYFSNGDKKD